MNLDDVADHKMLGLQCAELVVRKSRFIRRRQSQLAKVFEKQFERFVNKQCWLGSLMLSQCFPAKLNQLSCNSRATTHIPAVKNVWVTKCIYCSEGGCTASIVSLSTILHSNFLGQGREAENSAHIPFILNTKLKFLLQRGSPNHKSPGH